MLVTFSSKAGGDVLMLGEHAKPILVLAGKIAEDPFPVRGVFCVDQLPEAIQRLEGGVANETLAEVDEETIPSPFLLPVSLRQRAFPLLDLMRKAQKSGKPVLWETGSGW